jgi:drug/metabolite transporter (DMT)-like permease
MLQKMLMRGEKADPIVFTIASQIIPAILIFLYTIATTGFHMPNLLAYPINSIIMVTAYACAAVLSFKAMGLIDASEFSVLFVTRVILVIFIAMGFLHEQFSALKIIGSILIILSVMLVSWKKRKITFGKGEVYALVGAFFMGVGIGNDGYLSVKFDTLSYLVLAFLLPGIALMFIYPKKIRGLSVLLKQNMAIKMLLLCIFAVFSAVTYFLAFKYGNNVGQVAILNQTTTILTVLFSAVLLKETKNLNRKILGAIIAFLGVILLR